MKKLIPLVEKYYAQQQKHEEKVKTKVEILKLKLTTSKELLNKLRFKIRDTVFKDNQDEINFFKNTKPKICADFIYYSTQIQYLHSKPN